MLSFETSLFLPGRYGSAPYHGGLAIGCEDTRFANVDNVGHCVRIYTMSADGESLEEDPIVFGVPGEAGRDKAHMNRPMGICSVSERTGGSFLIADLANDRVVEITSLGTFVCAHEMTPGSLPAGVAYCLAARTIAVACFGHHEVVFMDYFTGLRTARIASGLLNPWRIVYSPDESSVFVAEYSNHRVCQFDAASGLFIKELANWTHKLMHPRDLVCWEDGSLFVIFDALDGSTYLHHVDRDGVLLTDVDHTAERDRFQSLAFSSKTHSLLIKTRADGEVQMFRDMWFAPHCARFAFVLACCK